MPETFGIAEGLKDRVCKILVWLLISAWISELELKYNIRIVFVEGLQYKAFRILVLLLISESYSIFKYLFPQKNTYTKNHLHLHNNNVVHLWAFLLLRASRNIGRIFKLNKCFFFFGFGSISPSQQKWWKNFKVD